MKRFPVSIILFASAILLFSCHQKRNQDQDNITLPHPDHIVIVIEENHGYGQIIGAEEAPYMNKLAEKSALFTSAHGITHPSQPNYLALFSGSTQGVKDDHCLKDVTPYTTPNLAASLIKKGFSFKGYAQTMPFPGFLGCNYQKSSLTGGYLYARKHTPWVNWQGTGKNNIPDSLSQPMTAFPKDFNQLPTVAFVIPDQDHDMHNIGKPGDKAAIQRGDEWLKSQLDDYVQWAQTHNSMLILTFDEDQFTLKNQIVTLFMGPMVQVGKYSERIDHYSVLRTIENMYGLPVMGTSHAGIIKYIWKK